MIVMIVAHGALAALLLVFHCLYQFDLLSYRLDPPLPKMASTL